MGEPTIKIRLPNEKRRILVDNPDNNPRNLTVYDLERGGKFTRCLQVNTLFDCDEIGGVIVLTDDTIEPCDIPSTGLSFIARVEYVTDSWGAVQTQSSNLLNALRDMRKAVIHQIENFNNSMQIDYIYDLSRLIDSLSSIETHLIRMSREPNSNVYR